MIAVQDEAAHTAASQDIAADLLEGVPAIAKFLGWTTRRVYRAREEGWSVPIRKRQGMGIYAFRSELRAWLSSPDTLASSS